MDEFRFELGFGVGGNFVRSSLSENLDFDAPDRDPAPLSSAFTTLNHGADMLDWAGGMVPSIGVAVFSFAVDVPDNLQNFHPGGFNRFTLRQTPAVAQAAPVPEPQRRFYSVQDWQELACDPPSAEAVKKSMTPREFYDEEIS